MRIKAFIASLVVGLLLAVGATAAYAHGVVINYTANDQGEIEFEAAFDNGEPLAKAQVTIYAPSDPATPYLTAEADEDGHYVFMPDQVGRWSVQFRVAGHGDIVHLDIAEVVEPVEIQAETSKAVAGSDAAEADLVETDPVDTAAEDVQAEKKAVAVAQNASVEQPQNDVMVSISNNHRSHSPQDISETAASSEASKPAAPARRLVISSGSTGFTTPQILLMSASVVWGFIGTALYFSSQRKKA